MRAHRLGASEHGSRRPESVESPVVFDERRHRGSECRSVRLRILQKIDLSLESRVFVGIIDRRGANFFHLESQQVDFAGARPLVATHRGESSINLGDGSTCSTQRREIGARKRIERIALRRGTEQALVFVLTVQIDEFESVFGQACHGRKASVDIGTRPAVARHHAAQDSLRGISSHEPTFDTQFVGPGAHH